MINSFCRRGGSFDHDHHSRAAFLGLGVFKFCDSLCREFHTLHRIAMRIFVIEQQVENGLYMRAILRLLALVNAARKTALSDTLV